MNEWMNMRMRLEIKILKEKSASLQHCMKNIKMCKYKCLKIYVVEKMICSTDVQCQKNDSLTSGFQLSKLNIFFFYFRINNSKTNKKNWVTE